MAEIGITLLLFEVGLGTDIKRLVRDAISSKIQEELSYRLSGNDWRQYCYD